ncbi:hypothetical protein F5Y00DRAFT_264925 [Daldinia vernicosa]|uniref:uncharacterized protein n=1 Tax=Daldinia vernicosa TaxID=114800 RepID=UPI002007D396|nr:uncharacterized protein F5Y00DRAFT_264925 [Daldinia vernicosa]KAI0846030.1 hypothetical protein F5Y00DRAFT_264925 [Daldinia vernicosa]
MANLRQQPSSFRRSLLGFLQAVFAIALFAIFVIVWTYAAALVPAVCILAVLFIGAGIILMTREQRQERNSAV